jgi:hypothetical protein
MHYFRLMNQALTLTARVEFLLSPGEACRIGHGFVAPMAALEYFIDIILPAALLALGLTQPLTEMRTRSISWRVKSVGAWG